MTGDNCLLRRLPWLGVGVILLAAACSDTPGDTPEPDAGLDDAGLQDGGGDGGPDELVVGPLQEMPLLASPDPTLPFNHSAEVTVTTHGDHVALAYINMHFHSASTFDTTDFHKHVGVVVSHNRGDSFSDAIDPGNGDQTTDPVIRVGADGTFYLATFDTGQSNMVGAVWTSADSCETWQPLVENIPMGDKEWIVVDDANGALYFGALSGFWKYDLAGNLLATSTSGSSMQNAYVDSDGARFVSLGTGGFVVLQWDGSAEPAQEGEALSQGGDLNFAASIGRTVDGGQWIVRATGEPQDPEVVLRVRHLPGDAGSDLRISQEGNAAFCPAAALDSSGRLHAIWYEIEGSQGALKYARSLSSDLTQGFSAPVVIDPDACPGGDWYPSFSSADGGRRLREYIDIAVAGNRAHLAWTHAPVAPSRVYSTYVQF